jgi:alanyl-tRNA synthetase
MPTKRLYYFDSDNTTHTATVTDVKEVDFEVAGETVTKSAVELDETIFHPQGGGQPDDQGTIDGIKVCGLIERDEDGGIEHVLEDKPSFRVGDRVALVVDTEPRLLFTRLHSGGHLLAHLAQAAYPNLKDPNGFHFPTGPKVTFAYEGDINKQEMSEKLNRLLADAIAKDTAVVSEWSPENGRSITMAGYTTGCGGTHVKSLGQLGGVSIRKIETKKEQGVPKVLLKYSVA